MCIYVFYLIIKYCWIIMISRILGERSGLYYSINTCFVKKSRKPKYLFSSVQSLSHVWLCDPMDCSMPSLPVHHQLPEFTQTLVHWVSDAIQLSHPLSSLSPPSFSLSLHQGFFQISQFFTSGGQSLKFQLQHQSFQWTFRIDFL